MEYSLFWGLSWGGIDFGAPLNGCHDRSPVEVERFRVGKLNIINVYRNGLCRGLMFCRQIRGQVWGEFVFFQAGDLGCVDPDIHMKEMFFSRPGRG